MRPQLLGNTVGWTIRAMLQISNETPAAAVEMLLRHVPLRGPVLEPSAGLGAIVKELRHHGVQVRPSDLYDHGADPALGVETAIDFLRVTSLSDCRSIRDESAVQGCRSPCTARASATA
jgi:hypothetical protein